MIIEGARSLLTLGTTQDWLENTSLPLDELRAFRKFGDDHYVRNLVHDGPAYQALLLCWKTGQRSPIHDHHGSNCAVMIIQGTATETLFEHADNEMVIRAC